MRCTEKFSQRAGGKAKLCESCWKKAREQRIKPIVYNFPLRDKKMLAKVKENLLNHSGSKETGETIASELLVSPSDDYKLQTGGIIKNGKGN
jgi:hypothetical protein